MKEITPDHEDPSPLIPEPGSQFVDDSHKWKILFAIGIGTFMSALDGSVVNTTLPIIRQTFTSSVAAIEWVVTIYLLVLSGLLLSFGRLGDLVGHKRIYMAGFIIFVVCSALCGLAPTLISLVIFRGMQALGAAMLQANSPAILTGSFPAQQRGQALGLQATMTYLGLTVGPSLGGWLAGQFGWSAIFFINVPVGMVAYYLGKRFIPSDKKKMRSDSFDLLGSGLFSLGLLALMVALNQGGTLGWLSWPILLSFTVSIVLLTAFIRVELRSFSPLLDLSLFINRTFSISVISAIINYIGVYSITFLMPFYLIQGRGLEPAQAGLILTAMPLVMAMMAPISGLLSDRLGTKALTTSGMVLLSCSLILLTGLSEATSWWSVVFRLIVAGIGIGIFISPNTSALMGSAPKNRQGTAAGIHATSRNFGMVLGVGYAGAVFTSILGSGHDAGNTLTIEAVRTSFLASAVLVAIGFFITFFQRRINEN